MFFGMSVNYYDLLQDIGKYNKSHPIDWASGIGDDGLDKLEVYIGDVTECANRPNIVYNSRHNPVDVSDKLSKILGYDCVFIVSAGHSPKSSTVNESHMYLVIKTKDVECANKLRDIL